MASMQKNKGSTFERDISKALSQRYGENFVRTAGSGAYVGGKNTVRKDVLTENQIRAVKGDIQPPCSFFKMNMECKSYKDFTFHLLFSGKCGQLDEWILQTLDAADEGDVNIMIMKFNRIGQYVCVYDYEGLDKTNGLHYRDDWYFYSYDTFFKDNEESFKIACGKD